MFLFFLPQNELPEERTDNCSPIKELRSQLGAAHRPKSQGWSRNDVKFYNIGYLYTSIMKLPLVPTPPSYKVEVRILR